MARQGGSFGIVILVVVVAIVLLLVAQAWKNLAPAASQVAGEKAHPINDHGQTEAGQALRSGQIPDLKQMKQSTSERASQTQEALQAVE